MAYMHAGSIDSGQSELCEFSRACLDGEEARARFADQSRESRQVNRVRDFLVRRDGWISRESTAMCRFGSIYSTLTAFWEAPFATPGGSSF
jgi:hypothetical protein